MLSPTTARISLHRGSPDPAERSTEAQLLGLTEAEFCERAARPTAMRLARAATNLAVQRARAAGVRCIAGIEFNADESSAWILLAEDYDRRAADATAYALDRRARAEIEVGNAGAVSREWADGLRGDTSTVGRGGMRDRDLGRRDVYLDRADRARAAARLAERSAVRWAACAESCRRRAVGPVE